jgi:hypothetical protein
MTEFDINETITRLQKTFQDGGAHDNVAVARFTAHRALTAYGCPEETADYIASMIFWAAQSLVDERLCSLIGLPPNPYNITEKAQEETSS